LADICEYELPTNVQNFTQKDLTKKFQKATFFLKHPVGYRIILIDSAVSKWNRPLLLYITVDCT